MDGSDADCLIYSVGIGWTGGDLAWERALRTATGCEVHAFDPTPDLHPREGAAGTEATGGKNGVHFHALGLRDGFAARHAARSGGGKLLHTTSTQYLPIDPARLLSFRELQRRLGHTGRTLALLAVDCEGCEWGLLDELYCSQRGMPVRVPIQQLLVEAHFQRRLGINTSREIDGAARAIECMERRGWVRTSSRPEGLSPSDVGNHPRLARLFDLTSGLRSHALLGSFRATTQQEEDVFQRSFQAIMTHNARSSQLKDELDRLEPPPQGSFVAPPDEDSDVAARRKARIRELQASIVAVDAAGRAAMEALQRVPGATGPSVGRLGGSMLDLLRFPPS